MPIGNAVGNVIDVPIAEPANTIGVATMRKRHRSRPHFPESPGWPRSRSPVLDRARSLAVTHPRDDGYRCPPPKPPP